MIVEIKKEDFDNIENLVQNFPKHFKDVQDILHDLEINVFSKYFIFIEKSNIIGFINYYDMYDRFEIANIVVLEKHRNKKVGSQLIEKIINIGMLKNISNITLEVKCDNVAAIKLYEKYNFVKVAIRKNYYNGIDGILMERKMM